MNRNKNYLNQRREIEAAMCNKQPYNKVNMALVGMTTLCERVEGLEADIKELQRQLREKEHDLNEYTQEAVARGWERIKPLGVKVTTGTAIYNNWYISRPTEDHVTLLENLGLSVSPEYANAKYLFSASSSKQVLYCKQKPDIYFENTEEIVLHNRRLYFKER